jgi:hypothetical protein
MTTHVFRKKRGGFNAIELVVVIFVVFILIGVALVVLRIQRDEMSFPDANTRTETNNKLKQLSLACHSFHDVYKKLPPAFDRTGQIDFPASVHVHLLPFIEQDNLYKVYLAQEGKGDWDKFIIPPFISPQDATQINSGAGHQNFAANLRVFSDKGIATKFDADMPPLGGIVSCKASFPSIADGTSNTIFFTTKYGNCKDGGSRFVAAPNSPFAAYFGQNAAVKKAHPTDPAATFQNQPTGDQCLTTPLMAQSMMASGLQVGFGDGSVWMINLDISPRTWNMLVQPNDGLEPGDDWPGKR